MKREKKKTEKRKERIHRFGIPSGRLNLLFESRTGEMISIFINSQFDKNVDAISPQKKKKNSLEEI